MTWVVFHPWHLRLFWSQQSIPYLLFNLSQVSPWICCNGLPAMMWVLGQDSLLMIIKAAFNLIQIVLPLSQSSCNGVQSLNGYFPPLLSSKPLWLLRSFGFICVVDRACFLLVRSAGDFCGWTFTCGWSPSEVPVLTERNLIFLGCVVSSFGVSRFLSRRL